MTATDGRHWRWVCCAPASNYFSDQYEALDHLCRGCTKENGWVDMVHPRGNICPWMDEAQQYDGKPMVDVYEDDEGHWKLVCKYRKERKKPSARGHRKAKGQTALSF